MLLKLIALFPPQTFASSQSPGESFLLLHLLLLLLLLLLLVSRQVVLRGVGGEGVGVLVVRVLAAVIGGGLPGQGDAGVVVRVDGLAEVDGVLQLLLQHLFTRVPGQLQQEETRVGLWQEVVGGVVLVQHLTEEEEHVQIHSVQWQIMCFSWLAAASRPSSSIPVHPGRLAPPLCVSPSR